MQVRSDVALGIREVTVQEFAAFVTGSNYRPTPGCLDQFGMADGVLRENPVRSWRDPGFAQGPGEPVVCVSWDDAVAYVDWLTRRTGQTYRLPSEAEWEYGARAGTSGAWFWGDEPARACRFANTRTAPEVLARSGTVTEGNFPCDDGFTLLSPAGHFQPNGFGLHDMLGNVHEWTADCNHTSYSGAPADGTAWLDAQPCAFRVMRGGSATNGPRQNRSASRGGRPASGRAYNLGFRVARQMAAEPASVSVGRPRAVAPALPDDGSPAAALFRERCAACHVDRTTLRGVYGRDQESVSSAIRTGGANTMSMPAWGGILSDQDIDDLASYVRRVAGWN